MVELPREADSVLAQLTQEFVSLTYNRVNQLNQSSVVDLREVICEYQQKAPDSNTRNTWDIYKSLT